GPFYVRAYRQRLVDQLQAELDTPRTTRAEHRVVPLYVRRGAGTTEIAPRAWIHSALVRGRNREVGAVEEIEKLRPELDGQPLLDLPFLGDREIDVVIRWNAENVAAGVAYGTE